MAYTALALAILAAVRLLGLAGSVRGGIILGTGLAFANGLICLYLAYWAFTRSEKLFYFTFFGGMIWKLLILGVTVYFLIGVEQVHLAAVLIAMAAMTFFYNLLEIRYLPRICQRN